MKAFVYNKYGSSEVLTLTNIKKTRPRKNEVLVRVKCLSINPAEWHIMRAKIWMVRVTTGLKKPKNPILGADFSGEVEDIGADVTDFKVGDRVFGRCDTGGLSIYVKPEQNRLAKISDGVSYQDAAVTPLAAITALIGLRDKAMITAGQHILINGASGGIGTFAIQLAKYYQAKVTAVCSAQNSELAKKLGADEVIPYDQEDFSRKGQKYDVVLDLIGNRRVGAINRVLKPTGKCVVIGYHSFARMKDFMIKGAWVTMTTKKMFIVMDAQLKKADLEFLEELLSTGKIKPVIAHEFPFEQTPSAFDQLGSKRTAGKILISI